MSCLEILVVILLLNFWLMAVRDKERNKSLSSLEEMLESLGDLIDSKSDLFEMLLTPSGDEEQQRINRAACEFERQVAMEYELKKKMEEEDDC